MSLQQVLINLHADKKKRLLIVIQVCHCLYWCCKKSRTCPSVKVHVLHSSLNCRDVMSKKQKSGPESISSPASFLFCRLSAQLFFVEPPPPSSTFAVGSHQPPHSTTTCCGFLNTTTLLLTALAQLFLITVPSIVQHPLEPIH